IQAKSTNETYTPDTLSNGDTKKQLLARSRHLLYKSPNNWTIDQQDRAKLLFELYREIEQAYGLTNKLRAIYNQLIPKEVAMTKLAYWFNQVE
ncbi:transposase, partial [Vibrio vulnificus]|nr:transposase [Vibrio vulnificus]